MPRPPSFTPVKQAQVCAVITAGHSKAAAARIAHVKLRTLNHHALHNPAFRAALDRACGAAKQLKFEQLRIRGWRARVAYIRQLLPELRRADLNLFKTAAGKNSAAPPEISRADCDPNCLEIDSPPSFGAATQFALSQFS